VSPFKASVAIEPDVLAMYQRDEAGIQSLERMLGKSGLDPSADYHLDMVGGGYALWFTPTTSALESLRAFYHVCMLRYMHDRQGVSSTLAKHDLIAATYAAVCTSWPDVCEQLSASGWTMDTSHIQAQDAVLVPQDLSQGKR
jgi:hypothetical protein